MSQTRDRTGHHHSGARAMTRQPESHPRRRAPRAADQAQGTRAPRRYVWVSLTLLAAVLGLICVMLLGVFSVRRVNVVGANLPATAMVQAAAVTGQNIFTVQRDEIIERLRQVPSIAVTRVDTSFPDTVTIHAQLRTPYIAWRDGSTTYLLDANGNAIGTARAPTLPIIVSTGTAGRPDFPTIEAVRYASSVLPHDPDGALAPAQLSPNRGLVIVGRSGWHAILGSGTSQELGTRVATLGDLLRHLAGQGQALLYADLHLRFGYYCQRDGSPCRSLPTEFGGAPAAPTPGVTASQP